MSTVPEASGSSTHGVPPLFARLADDASLLDVGRPSMAEAVRAHLAARTGLLGGLVGLLICPVSRLAELVAELVKLRPERPVDISLAVDTGLGEVPKALSLASSRTSLLTARTVDMAAPADVDATWLERVAEFVPDDMVPVVEPRRPDRPDDAGRRGWLDGVRRVAEHGCSPRLRCGGGRRGAFPAVAEVSGFLSVVAAAGRPFRAGVGLHRAVRHVDEATGYAHHGYLNLLAGVACTLADDDPTEALTCTDGVALAGDLTGLDDGAARAVRGAFAGYGSASPVGQGAELAALGLL